MLRLRRRQNTPHHNIPHRGINRYSIRMFQRDTLTHKIEFNCALAVNIRVGGDAVGGDVGRYAVALNAGSVELAKGDGAVGPACEDVVEVEEGVEDGAVVRRVQGIRAVNRSIRDRKERKYTNDADCVRKHSREMITVLLSHEK